MSAANPLLVPAALAAHFAGIGERSWWRLNAAAQVPAPIHLSGRTLWRVQELQDWIEAGCPDRKTWEVLRKAKGAGNERPGSLFRCS